MRNSTRKMKKTYPPIYSSMGRRVCLGGLAGVFLLVTLGSSGCQPLRKKFIRQKKKDQQESEMTPILEPLDYPEKVYSPEDLYKEQYSFWQVWYGDLLIAINDQESQKRQIYNLDKAITHLEEMKRLLIPRQQQHLDMFIKSLGVLRERLRQPSPLGISTSIKLELESIGKKIRQEYRFVKVKEALVKNGTEP